MKPLESASSIVFLPARAPRWSVGLWRVWGWYGEPMFCPTDGDRIENHVCLTCHGVFIYDDDGVRLATRQEVAEIVAENPMTAFMLGIANDANGA